MHVSVRWWHHVLQRFIPEERVRAAWRGFMSTRSASGTIDSWRVWWWRTEEEEEEEAEDVLCFSFLFALAFTPELPASRRGIWSPAPGWLSVMVWVCFSFARVLVRVSFSCSRILILIEFTFSCCSISHTTSPVPERGGRGRFLISLLTTY